MNDEIKEILYETRDLVLYYAKDDEDYKRSVALFNVGKIEKILDYITNLEQVNKNQAKRNSRQRLANQKQQELILKLQQENEHLRTDLNTFKNTIIEVNKECNSLFNHLTKKDLDYKSRCEKADEFIQKTPFINHITKLSVHNILQNGSEEND